MTAFFWPHDIRPQRQEWRFNTRSAVSQSPLSGYSQVVTRPGGYWSADLEFAVKREDDLERLSSFLHSIADPADTVYLPDYRGMLASGVDLDSIVSNGTFRSVTADIPDDWGTDNTTAHYVGAGWVQVVNSTGASECRFYQEITAGNYTTASVYCIAFNLRLLSTTTVKCEVGTAIGDSSKGVITTLGDGGHVLGFVSPASGSLFISFSTDTLASGVGWLISNITCVPLLEVQTAASAGAKRFTARNFISHVAAADRAALRAGQLISVQRNADPDGTRDTYRLIANAQNRYASNDQAILSVEPALRRAHAASDNVFLGVQGGPEMRLADPAVTLADLPRRSRATVRFVEQLR